MDNWIASAYFDGNKYYANIGALSLGHAKIEAYKLFFSRKGKIQGGRLSRIVRCIRPNTEEQFKDAKLITPDTPRQCTKQAIEKSRQKNQGSKNPMFGKTHSDETKKRLSDHMKIVRNEGRLMRAENGHFQGVRNV